MCQRLECSCYEAGKCVKTKGRFLRKAEECSPSTIEWFKEHKWPLDQCEMNQVCENGSIFGNSYFALTDEDIEALKSGKVLYIVDEYGTFIAYAPKEVPK